MKWPWSYWEQEIFQPEYDLLIVGAGFSGLSTAFAMKQIQPDWRILVIDQKYFQRAASTRNAGFSCISSLTELIEDANQYGWDDILQLIEWRWQGLQYIEQEFSPQDIDWKIVPSGEFFLADGIFQPSLYLDRLEEANSNIRHITGSDYYKLRKIGPTPLEKNTPFIEHDKEGQLHPVKLYSAWMKKCRSAGVQFLETCTYLEHEETEGGILNVRTDQLMLKTRKILFCTNGKNIPIDEDVKTRSNLVLVTKPFTNGLADFNAHAEAGYIYTRNINNRLLIGGGRHILDQKDQYLLSEESKAKVRGYLTEIIHRNFHFSMEVEPFEYEWEGFLGTGQVKMPILKAVDNKVFVLGRLSGMGVALSAYLGQKMAKMIDRT